MEHCHAAYGENSVRHFLVSNVIIVSAYCLPELAVV